MTLFKTTSLLDGQITAHLKIKVSLLEQQYVTV